ncbi:peptidyl-prolyl cis-trans isomerase SurA [gamma proteobacterium HTCC2207]|jgi:peptidyl-prolyl cis-trans isomerase SurA|uniref:Chaperone SurA n=1 Tax=gamma proteobacterium HTCC2207 TaxID=314287 RepID=Q1YQX2_9GAMM|nr:peptidyl-prolyl cis-trans isomerase SurA [gamma proteobacterium HTCC2207]MBT5106615.1 molecular chaperone SurA [Porticoccaceae bacterium]MBT6114309.1 molecular chaperone SurA [Porticoccaceae bacterium]MBT6593826.1 molecular chaperone SurA [Porticoccaceae bacterium]MDB4428008.1 peptidylprolyl isomerase [Porticoccaceae bacterium]
MDLKKTCNTALLAVLLGAFSVTASAQIEILDKVVAIVDEDVVLESEVQRRLATIYAQIQQSGTQPPPQEIIVQQVLERLISERLQLNMGYSAGIRITDAELNDAMARIAKSNQLTMEQYAEQIHATGSTLSNVREEIRNEMILMRVQQGQVMRRIRISNQELDNFLNSEEGRFMTSPDVNVGHILLPVPSGKNTDEVNAILQRAQGILDQANSGTDFRQLAIANSADQTALQGGDLGWRKMAQLPGVFIEAVEKLEIDQVSEPIRSDAGYHLIKLYERKGGGEQLIEQHFARHILIKPNQIRDEATVVSQLTELRERIKAGEDFALLTKEFSEDPGSALNGGELGWSTPGMFVPEFEQTMGSIELNEVSAPFLSQFGWHILQVTERRNQDFSENITRNRAQNLLRQRKYEEELQVWLQEIRDEAFVEIKESKES